MVQQMGPAKVAALLESVSQTGHETRLTMFLSLKYALSQQDMRAGF